MDFTARIANAALALYGLENATVQLMRNYENLVFRVDADRSYALRICPIGVDWCRLLTEINWLAAIRHDTDLLVPKPLPNRNGDLVSQVDDRACVLFEWLAGEPVSKMMSPAIAYRIGMMMAKLHRQAEQYQPENDSGPKFDYDYFFGNRSWWQLKAKEQLSQEYQSLLPAIERAQALLKHLDELPKYFGMTHTDIHFSNVICDGGALALIDFGDCGLGYYLTDIAVTEAEFRDYAEADTLIRSFRTGYEAARGHIPSNAQIAIATVIASLLYLEWFFESESQEVREDKAPWLPTIIADMQRAAIAF